MTLPDRSLFKSFLVVWTQGIIQMGITGLTYRLSSKVPMLWHSVVHMRNDESSCVKNEKRELGRAVKLCQLSFLCTPGQLLPKMGLIVG